MSLHSREFRNIMGTFTTGVTIVTTTLDGLPRGITANSFTSVSLDPPLVMFCLGKDSTNFDAFMSSDFFAINILSRQQEALSTRFAVFEGDRFEGVSWAKWETGAPILDNVLAAIDCRRVAMHEAGDHIIIVGHVLHAAILNDFKPLLYFRGQYQQILQEN